MSLCICISFFVEKGRTWFVHLLDLLLKLIPELWVHLLHLFLQLISLGYGLLLLLYLLFLFLFEIDPVCYHHILHCLRKERDRQILLVLFLEVSLFFLSHSLRLLSQHSVHNQFSNGVS